MNKQKKASYSADTQEHNPFFEGPGARQPGKAPYNTNIREHNAQYEGPAISPNGKAPYNADTQEINRAHEVQVAPKQKEKSLSQFGPNKNRLDW